MLKESFLLIMRNLTQRKLRSALTTLGVIIGIAAIVAMVSATQGVSTYITNELEKLQGDRIIITPARARLGDLTPVTANLTERDVDEVSRISGVDVAYGQIELTYILEFEGEASRLSIVGISPSAYQKLDTLGMEAGRYLKDTDLFSAVIGYSVAHDTFKNEVGLRKRLFIKGTEFQVVGIHKKAGGAFSQADLSVYVPKDAMRETFNLDKYSVGSIIVGVKKEADINEVADRIEDALRRLHRVPKGEEDFTVVTPEYVRSIVGQITGLLSVLLGGVAGISLVVGTIGITNIMYVTVSERTREIGVMKAIGATNRDILSLFIIESGFISLLGGVIGILLGLGLGEGILYLAHIALGTIQMPRGAATIQLVQPHIVIMPELIVGVIVLSFLVGVFAGLFPARKASNLDPIVALRYE
jgi:putative ABC transport system permease protein